MKKIVLVLTTMPADAGAHELARTLVSERLAACVNLLPPMRSVYRWENAIADEEERQVVIKTSVERLDRLRDRLVALHPYQLPEFVVIEANASDAYLSWVGAETSGNDA